jgi:hypothetical protein
LASGLGRSGVGPVPGWAGLSGPAQHAAHPGVVWALEGGVDVPGGPVGGVGAV